MRIFLFIVFLLLSGALKAQPSLVFTPIVSENGLLENRVRNLNQLPDGRMVVVTEGMINLYNGSNFQNIHINQEKTIPLTGYTGFHHSYIDSDSRLWVKNSGKLMLVDIKKEQFNDAPEKVLKSIGVNSKLADFFIDLNKNIWFISADDRLWVYDRKSKKARTFRTRVSLCEGRTDQVYDLASIGKVVYLFYRSGNVVQFDYNSGKQLSIAHSIATQNRNLYSRTLYVIQVQNSLYQIRNGTRGILQSYNLQTGKWITVLEKSYWLNSLVADREGNLWISCREGLWFIDKSFTVKRFFPSLQMVDGKSVQTEVSTLFMDRLGSLWVGTLNRGLLYYHPDRFKFRNIGRTLFGSSINGTLLVTAMSEGGARGMLIGTNKGLFSYNNNTERLEKYAGLKAPISCNSIYKDHSGRTWVGESNGLHLLSGKDARFYSVGSVQNIYETKNGELFLCTQNHGFGKFDVKNGIYEPVKLKSGVFSGSVSQVVEWNGRFIGISHSRIFEYDGRKKAIDFPHDRGNKHAMYRHNNHQYNALLADSRGCLWFATQDGLNVWDPKLQKLYTLHSTDGLVGNNIKALAESKKGDIWISTSNGISSISVSRTRQSFLKFAIVNYNSNNGVIEGEFIERAAYIAPDSYFLAGGIDGFNIVHTDSVSKTGVSFKPLLSYFKLFGKSVSINTSYDGNVILQSSLATTQTIKLEHNQNFFTIGFIALNYINPTQTYYRYQLDGVDKSWREVSSIPGMVEAIYTDLAPGKYVFKVAAAGSAKFQGGNESQVVILIDTPFWNTIIARVIYILSIVFLFVYALRRYIRRKHLKILRSQNRKLEEIKASFFTNISHELRTPLTLILSPLESVLSRLEDGPVKHQLTGVQRNAGHLLDLVNQLLNFRKLEVTGAEKLNLDYCNICEYLEAFCRQFEELASSKKIILAWECKPVSQALFIDKAKLDIILNNLLSNALKFTPVGGTVSVSAHNSLMPDSGAEALMIRIEDTGIGIPKEDLPHVFNRFFQAANQTHEHTGSGIGLYMVNEYVSMHRGVVEVESEQNHGSRFTFYIPYNLRGNDESVENTSAVSKSEEGKAKILIIEDNEEFRGFLAGELDNEYHVFTANNGSEGLHSVYELHPDIVISDVMMPLMDGFELCRKLKADIQISHTPVILLTARSSDNAQIEGYEAGADVYISKPFSLNVLQLRIRKLIEQQKSRKALFKKAIFIQPDVLTTTNIDEKLVHKALDCVTLNITNPNYSVEQLSRDLNMDRTGLYRKMTSLTGHTPSSFIRSVRLKRAAQLILQNEHTIGEVADLVGFNNAAYFSKAFQEEYGVKPSQYRNDPQFNVRINS